MGASGRHEPILSRASDLGTPHVHFQRYFRSLFHGSTGQEGEHAKVLNDYNNYIICIICDNHDYVIRYTLYMRCYILDGLNGFGLLMVGDP